MTSTNTASVKILTRNGDNGEYLSYQIFERLKSDLLPASFEWNLNLKVFDLDFEIDGKSKYAYIIAVHFSYFKL